MSSINKFKISRIGLITILFIVLIFSAISVFSADLDSDVLKVRAMSGSDIEILDPVHLIGAEESNICFAIYSRLIRCEPGTSKTELDAAKEFKVSEDGKTISFTLKEGIQFHKGYGELTAEDVKFSFERFIDPEENSPYKSDFGDLDHVQVTGRYSGKIILKEPSPYILTRTLPMESGSIICKKAFEELGEKFATNPVGSGPYYFDLWSPGQEIILGRFDKYFGELPDFKKIKIYPIKDTKVAEMNFDRGSLDVTAISLDDYKRYSNEEEVKLFKPKMLTYTWFGFNHEKPPFDKLKVREAVRYAVDVDMVIAGAYNNIAERANSLIAPGVMGYWKDAPVYQPDIKKAKELLKEAGYPNGFKTTLYVNPKPEEETAVQIIQQNLKQAGIDATIQVMGNGVDNQLLGKESHSGLHYMTYSSNFDPGYWTEWFTGSQVGDWNYLRWSNDQYNELQKEAAVTMDQQKREQMYIDMQRLMDKDVACIWITNGAQVFAANKKVNPVFLAQYSQYRYWKK